MPLVSIIIPSYNQGKFIRETIESCLLQDYRPIEILVMDGGSKDETVAVLKTFDVAELVWISEPDKGVVDLYLPSFVSFRMTDIWRSFIAQRCLWALGHGVVFHSAEMFQDRNPHNLLRDFEQEVPGYLNNQKIREVLESTSLQPGVDEVGGNLHRCYAALIKTGFIPEIEMPLVEAWLADISK